MSPAPAAAKMLYGDFCWYLFSLLGAICREVCANTPLLLLPVVTNLIYVCAHVFFGVRYELNKSLGGISIATPAYEAKGALFHPRCCSC